MKMEQIQILQAAIENFGVRSRIIMAIEEMAELTNAFAKFERGRVELQDIVTEIADVTIMMEQLRLIYGPEKVDAEIERKIKRLEKRMSNG